MGALGGHFHRSESKRSPDSILYYTFCGVSFVFARVNCGSQTTVENCIGGHVNVLSDYKKT